MDYYEKMLFGDEGITIPSTNQEFAETWKPWEHEQSAGIFCPEEWIGTVHTALTLMGSVDPTFRITQVKEKFGGLRIYYYCSAGLPVNLRVLMQMIVAWAEGKVDALESAQ